MKSIYHNLNFHYSFILVALSYILTGYFKNLLIIITIIIVHELGHYLIGKKLNFKIKEIIIYPFGGLTKFESYINRSINEWLLISVMGIVGQSILFVIIIIIYKLNIISASTYNIFYKYHFSILFFNLLPISKLDGGEILNLLLNKITTIKKAYYYSTIISIITFLIVVLTIKDNFNYSMIMIITLLIKNIIDYIREYNYIINKFLLERHLYTFTFLKFKKVNNKEGMRRDYRHLFKVKNKYITEKSYLNQMFKNTKCIAKSKK
ncbi:MAG: hypothetical protein Q4G04_01710 [bacterium]|nr:hypothetical protein [bacterium]